MVSIPPKDTLGLDWSPHEHSSSVLFFLSFHSFLSFSFSDRLVAFLKSLDLDVGGGEEGDAKRFRRVLKGWELLSLAGFNGLRMELLFFFLKFWLFEPVWTLWIWKNVNYGSFLKILLAFSSLQGMNRRRKALHEGHPFQLHTLPRLQSLRFGWGKTTHLEVSR